MRRRNHGSAIFVYERDVGAAADHGDRELARAVGKSDAEIVVIGDGVRRGALLQARENKIGDDDLEHDGHFGHSLGVANRQLAIGGLDAVRVEVLGRGAGVENEILPRRVGGHWSNSSLRTP
ncbi:hypothetical protein Mapa_005820 [Marchantia paleacea]|nr:hypothetical protein Mapa_005820 [Marchantia paleacea]